MNSFYEGCRVRYINKGGGVDYGELGTLVGTTRSIGGYDMVSVRWDKVRPERHNCGELCEHGHGWNVFPESIELAEAVDFGDINPGTYDMSELFT